MSDRFFGILKNLAKIINSFQNTSVKAFPRGRSILLPRLLFHKHFFGRCLSLGAYPDNLYPGVSTGNTGRALAQPVTVKHPAINVKKLKLLHLQASH